MIPSLLKDNPSLRYPRCFQVPSRVPIHHRLQPQWPGHKVCHLPLLRFPLPHRLGQNLPRRAGLHHRMMTSSTDTNVQQMLAPCMVLPALSTSTGSSARLPSRRSPHSVTAAFPPPTPIKYHTHSPASCLLDSCRSHKVLPSPHGTWAHLCRHMKLNVHRCTRMTSTECSEGTIQIR